MIQLLQSSPLRSLDARAILFTQEPAARHCHPLHLFFFALKRPRARLSTGQREKRAQRQPNQYTYLSSCSFAHRRRKQEIDDKYNNNGAVVRNEAISDLWRQRTPRDTQPDLQRVVFISPHPRQHPKFDFLHPLLRDAPTTFDSPNSSGLSQLTGKRTRLHDFYDRCITYSILSYSTVLKN